MTEWGRNRNYDKQAYVYFKFKLKIFYLVEIRSIRIGRQIPPG